MKKIQLLWDKYQKHIPPATILFIAFMLRLPLLNGSFWLDEAAQALESARPLSEQFDIIPDFQPPLLHLIVHFALYFSNAEWWLRLVGALIPGLVTVWGTYMIGKKVTGEFAGAVAALLLATSSFHIFYSQELRPYSLPAMFAILSSLLVVEWKQWRPAVSIGVFAVITALGLYSSYLYPFVILGQVTYCLAFGQKRCKQVITGASLGAAAFLPWIPTFLKQLEEGQYVRQALPGWESVVSLPQFKALPLTLGKFLYGVPNIDFTLSYIMPGILIGVVMLVLMLSDYLHDRKKTLEYIKMFSIWLFLPLIASWLISFFVPVVRPKRLLFLLPILYLYIAAIVAPYLKKKTNSLRGGLAVLFMLVLALINLGGTLQYYSDTSLQRENWRRLYRQMTIQYPPSVSVAVYSFPAPFAPIRWYDTQDYPAVSTGALHVDQIEDLHEQLKDINNYKYVLVFDYLTDLTDPQRRVLAAVNDFGYHEVDQLDYPNIGFVRVFTKSESATAQIKY